MHSPYPRQWTATVNVCIDEDGDDASDHQPLVEYHLTVVGQLWAPTPPRWSEWDGGDPGDPGEIEVQSVRLNKVVVYDPLCRDEGTDLVYGKSYRERVEKWALKQVYGEEWVHDLLAERPHCEWNDQDDVDD